MNIHPHTRTLLARTTRLWNGLIGYVAEQGRDENGQWRDDWQAPWETLARGHGDCEDIALCKLWSLRGILPAETLRLHWLMHPQGGHMVVGYGWDQSDPLLLDNRSDRLLLLSEQPEYTPLLSITPDGQVYDRTGKLTPARIKKFDEILHTDPTA